MLNRKIITKLVLSAFLASTIAACTSSPDEIERVPDRSPQAQYTEAKNALNNQMYNRAITILAGLERRYPFGPLTRQVQLDLMFAYYKSGQFDQALPSIDRFIKLNPNHPQLDYVHYLRGLVNMETGVNAFQDFFGVENADKDMLTARDAFNDFKKVVETYPDSKYVDEAKQRMVTLLDKLARYEIVIAKYYLRREAYVAAINRCKYVLEYYQQSSALVPALEILVEAYGKLGLDELKLETE
ncbi:MAG: outer membrane protein assembly factor BamD, partial [Gammaproteobacteria bacterium]|nr:outer membrane protein assembly factor BamD [Gammaproteobacteria bacterium]